MRLYNTLTRQVEIFRPLRNQAATLYTCGPTVYDYMHIGNLRKFVFDDTLRRALQASGYQVKHVMNITDVGHLVSDADDGEDKLEKGATREGKTVWEVAQHYTEAFKQDISKLGILPPNGYEDEKKGDNYARATDFISQQIEIIKILLGKGLAYQTEQAIYFDVTKLPSYGELTGQKLSDKEVAARSEVVTDKNKHHPYDFALWFFKVGHFKNHSMHWPSPWGKGFPGWHLECSAIIHATLGDPIDIHTGGVDNVGTHHVNEMAQTEAAFDHKLANYWVHSEHLLVDGQKMSKSLGNFSTLDDVARRGYDYMALRLLFLQAQYRTQMNFTWESLEAAQTRLHKYRAFALRRFQRVAPSAGSFDPHMLIAPGQEFLPAVQNDLDTPAVLAKIDAYIDKVQGEDLSNEVWLMEGYLKFIDLILGLKLLEEKDITLTQKNLIQERDEARKKDDWAAADILRNKLLGQGIEIIDTARGAIWSRVEPS